MNNLNDLSPHARAQVKAAINAAEFCKQIRAFRQAAEWRLIATCFIAAARKLQEASHE